MLNKVQFSLESDDESPALKNHSERCFYIVCAKNVKRMKFTLQLVILRAQSFSTASSGIPQPLLFPGTKCTILVFWSPRSTRMKIEKNWPQKIEHNLFPGQFL